MIRKFFSFWGLMLTLTLFSFLLVMGSEEKPEAPITHPLAAQGLISSHDLSLLSDRIGVSVPYLSQSGVGQVEDIPFADGYAHLLTWTDENNVTVRCVRPAAAAALLRSDSSAPSGEYCTIDSMTAFVCTDGLKTELHFGDALAAYSLSHTGTSQTLIDLTRHLQFTH